MSQSLTLNLEQEQTAMSFADGKEDFSWLNDDEHLSESVEAIENFENDSNLDEVLGLEGDAKADAVLDDNMIFAKEKQVQHKQEQVTTPSIIVQGVSDGETDLFNGEEKKKGERDQTDVNFETLSATSDVSREFDGENPEAFELQNDVSINTTAEKNANPTAEIVTIDDEDVIELVDENANALHSEDDAGIEDDYDENESERSNEDELSSPQNPLNPGARCILEFGGSKRPMAIRPEVRLYEFMQFLKADLISQDRHMQEIVLTFRDLQSSDFLLVISQENYYAQQYTMRDMLHLHRNFQRAKAVNSTDLLIQMSVQDGFFARLQRVRCAIADATRANSAGNLPQNPIVLDDSNPGTPTYSEIPDNQDDETNHNNAILINSPGEGELVHTPRLGSPNTGNSSIKVSNGARRNQLLEIEDDDLPPYSDNEREDIERSSHLVGPKEKVPDQYELEETVDATLDDSLQDTREEYVFEEQPIDLNKVESLEHEDVFKNNGKHNNHDPGDFIKNNDQNGGSEQDRQVDQDLLLENFDNIEATSSKNQAETVDDLLPDFEEFEDDEIPLSTNHDTDRNVETFGDVDWTSNDLLTDELESTDLVIDSSISKIGKRNHDMLNENQVDDSSPKKARTT